MANMDSVFITQLYILNEIEKLGGSSMSLTTEIEELLEGKAQLEKILNSLMEEERGRTIKMVWLSKWFKEYWPVIGCPYGSGFRTDLFPVGPFYITPTFLMGFARTQGACSSLPSVLLFLTSSKGVRV